MKLRIAWIMAVVALAAVGCGKDKKKQTIPTQQTATAPGPSTDSADAPVAEDTGPAENPLDLGEAIYFEFDSAALDEESRETLTNNVEWLKENPERSILIEGHTDEVGTPEYNVALGEQRARASKEYMVRMGIDPSRIQILSYGEERPWSGEDTKNRRSMFIATKKK